MAYPVKGAQYRNDPKWVNRAEGGSVPLPRPRPDLEGAARQELGRRMRDTSTFALPDNQRQMRMPYQQDETKEERRRKALMSETDI